MVEKHNPGNLSRQSTLRQAAGVSDGFNYTHDNASSPLDLGASDDAPPAYGEVHDQLNLSQDGFNAGAAVTGEVAALRLPSSKPSEHSANPLTQMTAVSISISARPTGGYPSFWPQLSRAN